MEVDGFIWVLKIFLDIVVEVLWTDTFFFLSVLERAANCTRCHNFDQEQRLN